MFKGSQAAIAMAIILLAIALTGFGSYFLDRLPKGPHALGQSNAQSTQIYISGEKQGSTSGGMIALASTDESAVWIGGYKITGEAEITMYEANESSLLDYLTHDKDGKQTKKNPDVNQFRYITALKQNIQDEGSKVVLPIGETGIWYLKVKIGATNADAFVLRSNIGVLAKEGNDELIFWGQSFKTKKSVSDGVIKILNLQDGIKELQTISLDAEGIAKSDINAEADIALVKQNNDLTIVPLNLKYLNFNYSSWNRQFQPKGKLTRYFIFTDRPLYKPGDTVYFKAVLRDDDDARYSVPAGEALVKIYTGGSEKNSVFEKNHPISADGTISGQYQLPTNAKTDWHTLSVNANLQKDKTNFRGSEYSSNSISFNVQFFRKPEFFIDVTTSQTELIAGDKTSFKISGSYFSGQPMFNQKVKYTVRASDFNEYQYLTDQQSSHRSFDDDHRYGYWYGSNEVTKGTAILDKKGEAEIDLDTKMNFNKGKSQIFSIEATIEDGSQNPSFSRRNILIYAGEYGIYRQDASYGAKVNTPISLPITLVPYRNNNNVANTNLTAKIHREHWISYQEENKKYPSYKKEEEDLPAISVKTDGQGKATLTFTPTKIGSYTITVEGEDKRDNLVSKIFYSYVTADDRPVYTKEGNNDITITADKQKYLPTDTVRLTIFSPIPDRDIFLSLERGRVNRFQVVHLNGKNGSVEIPLVETDIPNMYAKISSFSNSTLGSDSVNVIVSSESKKLVVNVTPNSKTFGPGEAATVNLSTTDTAGNPISAELALWAVDKAIFELSDNKLGDIFDTFWRERYNSTEESHSLEGILVYQGEGGGGGEGRSIFKDTAYWNPSIKTDASGRAQVSFKLPDNLTTWTIAAVAATQDTRVGQTTNEITVTKDVIVRPILPNMLRVGDEIVLSALAQNFTEQDQTFDVELKFDSGEVEQPLNSDVVIKKNETEQFYWKVKPTKENEKSKLVFSARAKENANLTDIVTQEIPIRAFGFEERRAEAGEGGKSFSVKLAPDTDKEKSKVTLSLSPTMVGSLPTTMKYLINYPYGCVEQTTSSLVPAVIAKTNQDIFSESLKDKNTDDIIQKGIARLSSLQRGDGGWAWWSSGKSDPFVTAYVVEYVLQAKQLGITVDDSLLKKAQDYLGKEKYYDNKSRQEVDYPREDLIAKNYGLALLGAKDKVKKVTDFNGLSTDLLSLAVIANHLNGDKNPQTNGLNQLVSMAQSQGEAVFWEAGIKVNFGSKDASTALAIRAILIAGGDNNLAIKGGRYLARNRQSDYWSNTYATAQVIRALTDLSKKGGELNPNYTYAISLDGKEIANGKVTNSKQNIKDIIVPVPDIKNNGSSLTITKTGEGQIYSTLLIDEFHTDRKAKELNHGLLVKREYVNEKGEQYSLAVGDTALVKITVSGLKGNENYGVIKDELPAGLIPINQSFKNEQYGYNPDDYYTSYDVTDREVTENGMILSLYQIAPEERVYTYRARVVSEGNFTVPPAIASLMYAPEIYGRSEAQIIKIDKESKIIPLKKTSDSKEINSKTIFRLLEIILLVLIAVFILRRRRVTVQSFKDWFRFKKMKDEQIK